MRVLTLTFRQIQSLGDILISSLQQGDEETRVIFLNRMILEKIKQKEQNRLSAYVIKVGMTMVRNKG